MVIENTGKATTIIPGPNGDKEQPITEAGLKATIQELRNQLEIANLKNRILELERGTTTKTTKSGLGGRKVAKPVLDTKTNKVYHAESAAGMAVAHEYGLSATKPDGSRNSFVWYQISDRETRFRHLTPEEYKEMSAQAQTTPEPKVETKGKKA